MNQRITDFWSLRVCCFEIPFLYLLFLVYPIYYHPYSSNSDL